MENSLDIDFSIYDIGGNYYRENKKCLFDPIREILIIETPEEIIRQKFITYLMNELDVPKNKIGVEVPMSRFKKGSKGRADIIVYEEEDGCDFPLILIECKANNVSLVDDVWFQAYKYDKILGTGFIIITNGTYTYGAILDKNDGSYNYIKELPNYKQLLSRENIELNYSDQQEWKRPNFSEIRNKDTIKKLQNFGWIGEDTEEHLYPFIINLVGFIQDTKVKFSPVKLENFNIIQDGDRYTSFGNAGGGSWEGDYRYLMLEDAQGNHQIISISILGGVSRKDHPKLGNRRGSTILLVAIDTFDKRHNSLQLNLDKYTKIKGNKYTVWHDGTLTIGKRGAAKKKEVIDYIRNKNPSMINQNGTITLGTFDGDKEIVWSCDSSKQFIKNLIKYAVLRDEFRRIKQSK